MNNEHEDFDDFLERVGSKHNITTIYFIVENSPQDNFSVDIDTDIWQRFVIYCERNHFNIEKKLNQVIMEYINKNCEEILND